MSRTFLISLVAAWNLGLATSSRADDAEDKAANFFEQGGQVTVPDSSPPTQAA